MLEFTMVIFLTMKIIYADLCYISLNFKNKKNLQYLKLTIFSNFCTFFNMLLILKIFVQDIEHT